MGQLIFYLLGHLFMGKRSDILGVYAQRNLDVSVVQVILHLRVGNVRGMTQGVR